MKLLCESAAALLAAAMVHSFIHDSFGDQTDVVLPDNVTYEIINNCGDQNVRVTLNEGVESYIASRKKEVGDLFQDKTGGNHDVFVT